MDGGGDRQTTGGDRLRGHFQALDLERTLAWLMRNRRLSKDYEFWETCSAAYLYLASIRLLTMRLTCVTS